MAGFFVVATEGAIGASDAAPVKPLEGNGVRLTVSSPGVEKRPVTGSPKRTPASRPAITSCAVESSTPESTPTRTVVGEAPTKDAIQPASLRLRGHLDVVPAVAPTAALDRESIAAGSRTRATAGPSQPAPDREPPGGPASGGPASGGPAPGGYSAGVDPAEGAVRPLAARSTVDGGAMRWARGGRREQSTEELPAVSRPWTGRLTALGSALDATSLTFRDLSISITGDETWVCGWAWFAGRMRSGWSVLALRLEGDRLVLVEPGAPPLDRAVGDNARPAWTPRLRAVGLLLDRSAAQLHDPWIVEVGDGFVVTVLTAMDAARGGRAPLSREFGAADLVAALSTEATGREGEHGRAPERPRGNAR